MDTMIGVIGGSGLYEMEALQDVEDAILAYEREEVRRDALARSVVPPEPPEA